MPPLSREPRRIRYRAVMLTTIEDIRTIRAELQQFDAKQTGFAVRFHIAVVDANGRAASEGHDDPIVSPSAWMTWRRLSAILGAAAVHYGACFAKQHCQGQRSHETAPKGRTLDRTRPTLFTKKTLASWGPSTHEADKKVPGWLYHRSKGA
jgi:hypothetical protein